MQVVLYRTSFVLLVFNNTLYDTKHKKKRETAKRARSWGEIASHVLRIAGTFCVICVLWSLWISTSVSEWLALWSVPGIRWKDITIFVPALIVAFVVLAWSGASLWTENLSGPIVVTFTSVIT